MIKNKIIRGLIVTVNFILAPVLLPISYIGSLIYVFIKSGTDEFVEDFVIYSKSFWGGFKDGCRVNLQFLKDGNLDIFSRELGL